MDTPAACCQQIISLHLQRAYLLHFVTKVSTNTVTLSAGSDSAAEIWSIFVLQYEDVGNVVIQNNNGEIITPEQLAREVNVTGGMIASQQIHVEGDMMTTQTITEEQMDDSFRHLITHERTGEYSHIGKTVCEVPGDTRYLAHTLSLFVCLPSFGVFFFV